MDIAAIDRWAIQGQSRMHRASPLAKIMATVLFIFAVIIAQDPFTLLILYIALASMMVLAKLPLRRLLIMASYPVVFGIPFAISYWNGHWQIAATIMLKTTTAAMAMILLITTTPYPQVFSVLQRLLPRIVTDGLFMTYRSFFVLLESMDHLIIALRLRGGIERRKPFRTSRNIALALGVLLVHSIDMVQHLYDTLILRGYNSRFPTEHRWKRFTPSYDWLPVLVGVILFINTIIAGKTLWADAITLTGIILTGAGLMFAYISRGARQPVRPSRPSSTLPPSPPIWGPDRHVEEDNPFDHEHPEAEGEIIAHISCVRHTYADKTKVSLCGLDFIVTQGQRIVVLGPNGSGKSTLLYHLLGLLKPDEGTVRLFDHDPARHWSAVRERVGVVLQNVDEQILAPTVYDDIAFSLRNYGHPENEIKTMVEEMTDQLGISHLLEKVPHYLSGGEKRKVALAGALVLQPELLIMDEPFEGLDPRSREDLVALLNRLNNEKGTSMIITTHEVNIVPLFANSVYMLVHGGGIVTHGSPRRIFSQSDILARSNIEPPVLAQLFQSLRECGLDLGSPLTVEEATELLVKWAEQIKQTSDE